MFVYNAVSLFAYKKLDFFFLEVKMVVWCGLLFEACFVYSI